MRLPWVSREQYEYAVEIGKKWGTVAANAFDRYDALLEKYHTLRLAGAAPEPAGDTEPWEPSVSVAEADAKAARAQRVRGPE